MMAQWMFDPVQIRTLWRDRVPTNGMGPRIRYTRLTKPILLPTQAKTLTAASTSSSTSTCATPHPATWNRAARSLSTITRVPPIPIPTSIYRRSWTRHHRLSLQAFATTTTTVASSSLPYSPSRPLSTSTPTRFQRRMNLINPRDERGYIPIADHGL